MLQYTPFRVPFLGGLDTKSDAKTLEPGKLLRLENGEFTKRGSVRSRPGHTAVSTSAIGGPSDDIYGTPVGLGAFGKQLALLTTRSAYVYSTRANAWSYTSAYNPISHVLEPYAAGNVEQTRGEVATSNGITVYAWEEPGTLVRFNVVDAATGAYLGGNSTSTGYSQPRAFAIGNNLFVTFVDEANDNIRAWKIRTEDVETSAADADFAVVTDLNSVNNYSVVECTDDYAVIAWDSDDSVEVGMRIATLDNGGALALTGTFTDSTDDPTTNIALAYNPNNGQLFLAYGEATPLVKHVSFQGSDITELFADTYTPSDDVVSDIAIGVTTHLGTNGFFLAVTVEPTIAGSENLITELYWEVGADSDTVTIRHSYVRSEAFFDGNQGYVLLGHQAASGLQNSYYLYNWKGELVGQVMPREADNRRSFLDKHLSAVRAGADGTLQAALPFRRTLDSRLDDIAVFEHSALKRAVFSPGARAYTEQMGKGMYATGSMLWHFDGKTAQESGFTMFPDITDAEVDEAAGTVGMAEAAEVFSYRVYYCKRMRTGEVFRSAAITVNHTTIDADTKLQLSIPTLAFTACDEVWVEVYRTKADSPDVFFLVSGQDPSVTTGDNCWLNNDKTTDYLTFVDALEDTAIESRPIDYLTAGEAPNFPPPGPGFLRAIGHHVYAVGGAIEFNQIWFSKPYVDGLPVEFSTALVTQDTSDAGGTLVGIGQMGDIPVFFKEQSCFTLRGPGLDNFAQGEGFEASPIPGDAGVSNPGTIVSMPMGVAFFTNKGFYLLGLDGSLSYLGADVESYNGQDFLTGHLIPDTTQVVWVASDGNAVMFDYQYGQWGSWTDFSGLSSVVWGTNRYAMLRTDGVTYIRDTSLYTDGGATYSLTLRTAPLRPFETAVAFWKMNRFQLLGEYASLHVLRVKLYYNRELTPYQTFEFDPSTVIDLDIWGDPDELWGDIGDLWGGDVNPTNPDDYHFEKRPMRMKAQTISFEFECVPLELGAGCELSELLISAAPYPGMSRLAAGRKL